MPRQKPHKTNLQNNRQPFVLGGVILLGLLLLLWSSSVEPEPPASSSMITLINLHTHTIMCCDEMESSIQIKKPHNIDDVRSLIILITRIQGTPQWRDSDTPAAHPEETLKLYRLESTVKIRMLSRIIHHLLAEMNPDFSMDKFPRNNISPYGKITKISGMSSSEIKDLQARQAYEERIAQNAKYAEEYRYQSEIRKGISLAKKQLLYEWLSAKNITQEQMEKIVSEEILN